MIDFWVCFWSVCCVTIAIQCARALGHFLPTFNANWVKEQRWFTTHHLSAHSQHWTRPFTEGCIQSSLASLRYCALKKDDCKQFVSLIISYVSAHRLLECILNVSWHDALYCFLLDVRERNNPFLSESSSALCEEKASGSRSVGICNPVSDWIKLTKMFDEFKECGHWDGCPPSVVSPYSCLWAVEMPTIFGDDPPAAVHERRSCFDRKAFWFHSRSSRSGRWVNSPQCTVNAVARNRNAWSLRERADKIQIFWFLSLSLLGDELREHCSLLTVWLFCLIRWTAVTWHAPVVDLQILSVAGKPKIHWWSMSMSQQMCHNWHDAIYRQVRITKDSDLMPGTSTDRNIGSKEQVWSITSILRCQMMTTLGSDTEDEIYLPTPHLITTNSFILSLAHFIKSVHYPLFLCIYFIDSTARWSPSGADRLHGMRSQQFMNSVAQLMIDLNQLLTTQLDLCMIWTFIFRWVFLKISHIVWSWSLIDTITVSFTAYLSLLF